MKEDRFLELCAGAALGDLDDRERAELRAMADDDRIAAEIAAFERASAAVVASLHQASFEPIPASLSARLARDASAFVASRRSSGASPTESSPPSSSRAAISRPQRSASVPTSSTRTSSTPSSSTPNPAIGNGRNVRGVVLPWFVAAAACVVAAVLLMRDPGQAAVAPIADVARFVADHPDLERRRFELGCQGEVLWSPRDNTGVLELRDLPSNDPKQFQYQLWIFDESQDKSTPVDGGVFDVPANAAGPVVIPIDAKLRVGKAFAFAITKEQPGGVVVSAKRPEQIVAAVGL
ncbi:MAG: anti-sigma factor [Planctomycetota bacterium]